MNQMLVPTIVMAVIAVVLSFLAYRQGDGALPEGFKAGADILVKVIPVIILAFIIAGMMKVLIPTETIAKWIGPESGMRGVLIGTIAGGFTPGGPFTSMPIAAGFLTAGANVGTMVAFLSGWSLLAFSRLPIEVGLMGWKFTLIRLACTFFLPVIAGWLANLLFSHVQLFK